VSERDVTDSWAPWQQLIDSIGPYYRDQLFTARDQAKGDLDAFDKEQLEAVAEEGRRVASSLDRDAAQLTVSATDEREREGRLVDERRRKAEALLLGGRWWTLASRRRRQARAEAAGRIAQAEEHRRLAAAAHEQLRELGSSGRHLYLWFERHRDVLARGLAAEAALDAARSALVQVLGAPGIASLTAACLTQDRAIDLSRLERLVERNGNARQRLLFEIAAALYGRGQEVSLSDLLACLDGEDIDRVLYAIATVKHRQIPPPRSSGDLWIRASEPE
jgi:hypothetical protein